MCGGILLSSVDLQIDGLMPADAEEQNDACTRQVVVLSAGVSNAAVHPPCFFSVLMHVQTNPWNEIL